MISNRHKRKKKGTKVPTLWNTCKRRESAVHKKLQLSKAWKLMRSCVLALSTTYIRQKSESLCSLPQEWKPFKHKQYPSLFFFIASSISSITTSSSPLLEAAVAAEVEVRRRDGEREDWDKEDRELDESAGDLLQKKERAAQEGQGDHCSLWRRCFSCNLLCYWKDVRVLQLFHYVTIFLSVYALFCTSAGICFSLLFVWCCFDLLFIWCDNEKRMIKMLDRYQKASGNRLWDAKHEVGRVFFFVCLFLPLCIDVAWFENGVTVSEHGGWQDKEREW